MSLGCAALGLPMPSDASLLAHTGWLAPLLPFQRPPATCRASEQTLSWLGHAGGGRAVAPLVPSLLPCRSDGGALWVRPARFALPLSYPQFFEPSVGVHGEIDRLASEPLCNLFTPPVPATRYPQEREPAKEVMDVQVAAALQASSAICPPLRRISADWSTEAKSAERAAAVEGWGARDELAEVTESLAAAQESYAATDIHVGSTSIA